MMKKIFSLILIFVFLSGCAAAQPVLPSNGTFYTFTDATGAQITLPEKPKKTAVLFSSFAQIWTLCGGEIAVTVGESVERQFADSDVLLVDAGAGKSINEELLLAAQCDFVIGSADIPAQVQAIELLRRNGVNCALFSIESFEEYLAVLQIFSSVLENETAYEAYGTAVQAEINQIFENLPTKEQQPTILFIRSGASFSSAKAKTADSHFAAAMLRELGTYNIAEQAAVLTDSLSTEEILIQNPDYIFISAMGDEDASVAYMQSLLQTDAWQQLQAVQQGKVIFLPKDLFQYKPNHRWAEAYRYLAEQIR